MLPDFITNPNPEIFLSDNYLVIDLETTTLDKGTAINRDNSLLLSVSKRGDGTRHVRWGNEYEHGDLLEDIQAADFVVAHNAKFELQWLQRCGLDLSEVLFFDTQIAEYVLQANRSTLHSLGLGKVSKRYGYGGKDPFVDVCMKAGVDTRYLPSHWLEQRCVKDVDQTEKIFIEQRDKLRRTSRLAVCFTRCLLTPVLADIEFNGMCLDGERVEETYREHKERLAEVSGQLDEMSGGINMRSTKQLAEFIYGPDGLGFSELTDGRGNTLRTSSDKPKTDSTTLNSLKPRNKRQREFLSLRKRFGKVNAALSKNLEFFLGVVRERGGIFYGQFNQTITATQRLSASGRKTTFELYPKPKSVQFQNLPRAFKRLFRARKEGWNIAECDGAQLEFRVAAHLGKDAVATDAIRTGFDVHSFTADVLTKAGEPTQRQEAKAHTFKPLFGGTSGTKAQQTYYQAFRERYPGITKTQNLWIEKVLGKKELTIASGLTFYWPDTKLQKSGYVTNTASICNYPIQSYATADIIPIAVTKLWHDMKEREMESFLVNTIHDSAIAELHPDEEEEYKEIAFKAFTEYVYEYLDKVYDDQFTVPLGAEIKIGTHWNGSDCRVFEHSMEPPHIGD